MLKPIAFHLSTQDAAVDAPPVVRDGSPEPSMRRSHTRGTGIFDALPTRDGSPVRAAPQALGSAVPDVLRANATVGERAANGARPLDVEKVRELATEIGELEAQLAAFKTPPVAAAGVPVERSQAEVQQIVRRFEGQRNQARDAVVQLGERRERAREVVERLNVALAQKMRRLEQLHEKRGGKEADQRLGTRQTPTVEADPRAAMIARADEIGKQIELLGSSRKKAAREADHVTSRDALRSLGDVSMWRSTWHVEQPLVDKIIEWLRDMQGQRRSPRRSDKNREFDSALRSAFARIDKAATDPEANPQDALRTFLSMLSQSRLTPLVPVIEKRLAIDFGRMLYIEQRARKAKTTAREALEGYRECGLMPSQAAVSDLVGIVAQELETHKQAVELRAPGVLFAGEVLNPRQTARSAAQLEALCLALVEHREAFQKMIEAMEQQFLRGLEIDDIEAMAQKVAPKLDAYYDGKIKALRKEREAVLRAAAHRSQPRRPLPASSAAPSRTARIEQIEISISRLQGEILQYTEQYKTEFDEYGQLSAAHMAAVGELDEIDRQLAGHRETLQALRDGGREAIRHRAVRADESARLERTLVLRWSDVAEHPALERLITPQALTRALRMHVGHTPEQMRARMEKVVRTATFHSKATLLRAIADIATHELAKSGSALFAANQTEFAQIANKHPDGRIDLLCNHRRTIGRGVRKGSPDVSPTGTSQYEVRWVAGQGARISHLHPWIAPY